MILMITDEYLTYFYDPAVIGYSKIVKWHRAIAHKIITLPIE